MDFMVKNLMISSLPKWQKKQVFQKKLQCENRFSRILTIFKFQTEESCRILNRTVFKKPKKVFQDTLDWKEYCNRRKL